MWTFKEKCKNKIKEYNDKYLEARKNDSPFSKRKYYLDIAEAGERVMKNGIYDPYLEKTREELHKRTDKLLEQYEFLYGERISGIEANTSVA